MEALCQLDDDNACRRAQRLQKSELQVTLVEKNKDLKLHRWGVRRKVRDDNHFA
jgi:hypothetical protein